MICAGLLAEYYQKIGGKVEYYGKPYSEIYDFTYSIMKKRNEKPKNMKKFNRKLIKWLIHHLKLKVHLKLL